MAAFLSSLSSSIGSKVGELLKGVWSGGSPYEVFEISQQQLQKCKQVQKDGIMALYIDASNYIGVLQSSEQSSKAFVLFRLAEEGEAKVVFSSLAAKLQPLVVTCKRMIMLDMLQEASHIIRNNPSWNCAHVAAKMGLSEAFRNLTVSKQADTMCEETQVTPIQLAVQSCHLDTIQELLICGVQIDLADHTGNNVFHYAAKTDNPKIIQMLGSKNPASINQLNMEGESPLHVACLNDKPDNVEQLLRWEADPTLTMSTRYPIHCAMKVSSKRCVEILCRWRKAQITLQDKKYGGTPLHWAKSRECIFLLADLGCNLDAENYDGETALHVMIHRDRWQCFMALLSRGASANKIGKDGNNMLHMAIEIDNIDMVQALIVFGADINGINHFSVSPRHMVSLCASSNKGLLLYYLHRVGARRCEAGRTDCEDGCKADGRYNGDPVNEEVTTPDARKEVYQAMVDEVAMAAALTRSASASESAILGGSDMCDSPTSTSGDRILCLDGGGIRGLVLIQLLKAIEKAVGQPLRNCFDWIGGTSTGGILALALVHGKPIDYIQGFYFRLKDEVFAGKRPYDSEPLDKCLRREFGETTRMTEVEYPKVLVTGVLGDRFPAELHFFRNYEQPGFDYGKFYANSQFEPPPRATEQKVWMAARSSGAAPTYFRAMGRFVDGGLMANNPTLDVLTEVHEYNMQLQATNQGELVKPIHVVVSLGTGIIPQRAVTHCDVYRPEGLFDIAKVAFGATALGQILIDQATQSEGRPVERARAWCSMIHVPFHRLSPQLSEDIPLDCKDDKKLINMLWETECYINDNWKRILQIAHLIKN